MLKELGKLEDLAALEKGRDVLLTSKGPFIKNHYSVFGQFEIYTNENSHPLQLTNSIIFPFLVFPQDPSRTSKFLEFMRGLRHPDSNYFEEKPLSFQLPQRDWWTAYIFEK